MSAEGEERELGALVDVLRGAVPDDAELARLRRGVLDRSAAARGPEALGRTARAATVVALIAVASVAGLRREGEGVAGQGAAEVEVGAVGPERGSEAEPARTPETETGAEAGAGAETGSGAETGTGAEAETDTETDTETETRADTETGSGSGSGAETEAGPFAGAAHGPVLRMAVSATARAGSGVQSDARERSGADVRAGSGSGAGSETRAGSGSEAGASSGSEAGSGAGAGSGSASESGAGSGSESGAGSGSGSESGAGSGSGSESGAGPESGTGSGSESGAGSESGSGSGSRAVAGAGSGASPGSDTGAGSGSGAGSSLPPPLARLEAPLDAPLAPSALYAELLRAYAASRCDEAAVLAQRIVESDAEPREHAARAELILGECLHRLGFHHTAASVFDGLTASAPRHPHFTEALPWLGRLALALPDPAALAPIVGRYEAADLAALDEDASRESHETLVYLMGRQRYDDTRLDDAIALLSTVRPGSRAYVPARFFEGVAHVRQRHAQPAIHAFRAVIDAVGTDAAGGIAEADRLRDLAWISLARVYYSAAQGTRSADGDDAHARALLANAIDAWQRIPIGSEYWIDAFSEGTWAQFLAADAPRALGHVHGLLSPFFEDRAFPEAYVIRAIVYFEHCHWDAADATIREFHRRFDARLGALAELSSRTEDPLAAHELLVALRSATGTPPVAPDLLPTVRAALEDREILRALAAVGSIDRELERAAHVGLPIASTTLADRIAQELALARAFAITRTGDSVHRRIARLALELEERQSDVDAIELELTTQRRTALAESGDDRAAIAAARTEILAGDEHQLWPFDGEYWRDEVDTYREVLSSRCAR